MALSNKELQITKRSAFASIKMSLVISLALKTRQEAEPDNYDLHIQNNRRADSAETR